MSRLEVHRIGSRGAQKLVRLGLIPVAQVDRDLHFLVPLSPAQVDAPPRQADEDPSSATAASRPDVIERHLEAYFLRISLLLWAVFAVMFLGGAAFGPQVTVLAFVPGVAAFVSGVFSLRAHFRAAGLEEDAATAAADVESNARTAISPWRDRTPHHLIRRERNDPSND